LPKKEEMTNSLVRYEWSSFPGYIQKKKRQDWIDYGCILKQFEQDGQNSALAYKKYVNHKIKKQISSPFKNLESKNILGSEGFRKEVFKRKLTAKRESQRDGKAMATKIIELVSQTPWSSLKNKKNRLRPANLSRNAAIYFLKRYTDLENQQIQGIFKSLKKSSISQMSRRFNIAKNKNKAMARISDTLEKEIKRFVLNRLG